MALSTTMRRVSDAGNPWRMQEEHTLDLLRIRRTRIVCVDLLRSSALVKRDKAV